MAEPLAWMLRPGSAGSNTAADHLQLLGEAIAALPPALRRRLMVTCDGAGASHDLVKELDRLASRHGYQVTYSVGWALGAREKAALGLVPEAAWEAAIDGKGQVRERRADDACANPRCAHRACWIEEAHVTELTGLLREGPGGDQLKGWPKTMRVFARRERPHPGAQLSLFEAADGWRYSLWATNLPAATRGWRGQCAYIDAAHRVHARVEDVIRTGKDTGPRSFPLPRLRLNQAWLDAVHDRLHPAVLAQAARPGRRPRESRAEDAALPRPARRRPPRPRRTPQNPENRRVLALGRGDHHRLAAHPGPPAPHLTSTNPSRRARKETPGPVEPPATRPDSRATVTPRTLKSRPRNRPARPPAAAINPYERSGLTPRFSDQGVGSAVQVVVLAR